MAGEHKRASIADIFQLQATQQISTGFGFRVSALGIRKSATATSHVKRFASVDGLDLDNDDSNDTDGMLAQGSSRETVIVSD